MAKKTTMEVVSITKYRATDGTTHVTREEAERKTFVNEVENIADPDVVGGYDGFHEILGAIFDIRHEIIKLLKAADEPLLPTKD